MKKLINLTTNRLDILINDKAKILRPRGTLEIHDTDFKASQSDIMKLKNKNFIHIIEEKNPYQRK